MLARSIVHGVAGDVERAATAIHHGVGSDRFLFQGCRVGYWLEGRAGLVDVAYSVISEQIGGCVTEVIRIERGPDGEGENLAGVRILHDDGAVLRVGAGHVPV